MNCMLLPTHHSDQADNAVYQSKVTYPVSFGCYTDSSVTRTLAGSYSEDSKMTPDMCIDSCQAGGYKYAGLEYGRQVCPIMPCLEFD